MADDRASFSGPGFSGEIRLQNVREIQNLLKQYAPDLRRLMDRRVRQVLEPVASRGKSNIPDTPLSRWHRGDVRRGPSRMPGFDAGSARSAVRVRTGGRKRGSSYAWTEFRGADQLIAYSIVQGDAGGAVFEVAGRRKQGSAFTRNMLAKNGPASRGIWRAWDSMGARGRVEREILGVVGDTIREYNRRLEEGRA